MKKTNNTVAKRVFRPWESLMKEESATLQDIKEARAGKHGCAPSGALVDLFRRLFTEKGVEDVMKYSFPTARVAQNFRDALTKHIHAHLSDKKDVIVVNRCEATVYIFRTA